jgi:type VI protein secretion system component Hcp
VRLLSLLVGLALLAPVAASAAPTPNPFLKSINPIRVLLNLAPTGTTLTVGSHAPLAVSSWSLTSDAAQATGGGAGAGKVSSTPLTVTVPFDSSDVFLQQDASGNTHETTAVLSTPQAKFTLHDVLISSFSVGSSGNQTTAQVTLTFGSESLEFVGGGKVTPCPSTATNTTICFPDLNPIVVQTWNMDTSNKSLTKLTFSASVGTQGDKLQLWQKQGNTIKCVTLLTSAVNYALKSAKLTSVQLEGSSSSSTANVAMTVQSWAAGATCSP